jgi:hypothetical protein
MSLKDVVPLTTLFHMSKVIQGTDRQIETGFAIIEHAVDVAGPNGEDLNDGTPEFEQMRRNQDIDRKQTIYRFLAGANVRCSERNLIVLEQPEFEHIESYWNSLRDLMRFWYETATRTLVLPGSALLGLFDKTVEIVTRVFNCENVNIRFDVILTTLIRDEFLKARTTVAVTFDDLFVQPIMRLTIPELKQLRKDRYIAQSQETAVAAFATAANEIHPFVCESFQVIFAEFRDGIRDEIATLIGTTYLNRCVAILLLDKVERLLMKVDAEIQQEFEKLRNHLELVESYPFSKFGSQLSEKTEIKLRKCMDKYDPHICVLRQYTKSVAKLRSEVLSRVDMIEIPMRREWNGVKDAKAEAERQALRAEQQKTIDKFEAEMKSQDAKHAAEAARMRDETMKQVEQIEQMFRRQIEEQNRVNQEREQRDAMRMEEMARAHQEALLQLERVQNSRPSDGGGDIFDAALDCVGRKICKVGSILTGIKSLF